MFENRPAQTDFAAPPAGPAVHPRYADLPDPRLARRLTGEDAAEEQGLDPFERVTCRLHRRWLHTCVHSPTHVVAVSGYRWCRDCACPAAVAIDQLTGDVRVTCTRCGRVPDSRATRQLVRTCRASVAAATDTSDGDAVRSLRRQHSRRQ
ncbi:hypothetical protein [Actinokineospora fastidiosa]|uniref:Uncharacterized protein n=1 Tax=Actinokineospora fastidiosa TaxID=1816 RepID=A0A918LBC1_9PSEU|nr:hypothetical protein [Actinokineospora fastidiosa]GGS28703.1 hypothetical protein GCM10010171_22280 [Actinokineospora fastidiosa]